MGDKADLEEQVLLIRIAVINSTFERLRYVRMPERVSLLVRSGWTNSGIFAQITSEQPLLVKLRLGVKQLMKVIYRRKIVFALAVAFLASAYFGHEAIMTVIAALELGLSG